MSVSELIYGRETPMKLLTLAILLLLLITLCSGQQQGAVQQQAFTYTTVDYPGAGASSLFGINNSGQVTGSWGLRRTLWRGFYSDGTSFLDLTFPLGAVYSSLDGINNLGII